MKNSKHYFSEFIGTFLLVLFGTGSIIISEEYNGIIQEFGIGIVFGLTVWMLVHFLGKISDCHINPAVTIGMMLDKKITIKKASWYILFQLIGALSASCFLYVLFPDNLKLGNTLPRNLWQEAFLYELFLSFILMLVILISTNRSFLIKRASFLIGFTVFLEAWLAGPVCGASMNPARTFGPAIVSGNSSVLWLYFAAPILGMALAMYIFKFKLSVLK
ncbi:hypothetical protein SY27_06865 [Flavobacterium sp. 316]|uniref:MIP/aquaporin family protein n=1 Tax=Flavobacterium sp. 316 TaxID=1603293 RepID=UPI0005DBC549|nr:aquaporin [Flavobacterium sp. 316]KIX21427.1 hypothetical protein SY27_06865 [Flavobacterium sp. 316]